MNASGSERTNKWAVLATVLIGVFMAMVDSSIVNVALPTVVKELHSDFATAQWIPLAYMLTVTCFMMPMGRLADMMGKRSLYAIGFAIFTLASVQCGLAGSAAALITARVIQGVGASIIMALGPAVLVEAFPPQERGRAIGITGSVVSLGIIVGPALGGLILNHMTWGWIFFVNVPLGCVAVMMVLRLVSAARPAQRQRFDIIGAVLLTAGLLGVLLGLTVGSRPGVEPSTRIALLAGGLVALVTFVLVELKSQHPLVDMRMFRNGAFSSNLGASFLNFIAVAGIVVLMPFYLQGVLHLSPQDAGLTLTAMPVVLGIAAPIAGTLSDRYGTTPVTTTGLVVVGIGFYLVRTLGTDTTVVGYILRFLPVGLGLGLFQSPNNSAIFASAPRDRMGVASGLLAVARTLGQTTGIAVLTSFWSGRVVAQLGSVPTGGVSTAPPLVQVSALHDTMTLILVLTAASLALVVGVQLWSRREKPAPLAAAGS